MKKTFSMCLLVCGLALILQATSIKAAYVNDDANVLSNEADKLERITADFYKQWGVKIEVKTVNDAKNIQELAKVNFFVDKLDKNDLLILYSSGTKELTVAHSECSLDYSEIVNAFSVSSATDQLKKGNYGKWFLDAVNSLMDKIIEKAKKKLACFLDPALEFNVDPLIYDPPSQNNPHGMALDKKLNPYDDGIVTVYDPLVCTLSNAGDLKEVEFTIKGKYTTKVKVKCNKGTCSTKVYPEVLERGKTIKCSVNIGNKELSEELTVAKQIFIFYPVNQNSLGDSKKEYEFFLKLSESNKKPEISIKPIYLNSPVEIKFSNNEEKDIQSLYNSFMDTYSKVYVYKSELFKDVFIAVTTHVEDQIKVAGFTWRGSRFIAISGKHEESLAHELGHSLSDLCDEYKYNFWERQNSNKKCPNPYPKCCDPSVSDSNSCRIKIINQAGGDYDIFCSGMPYTDRNTPSTNSGQNAAYYSAMGEVWIKSELIYPIEAKCPLRNCG